MQLACSPAVQKSAFYEPLRVRRVMDCSLHLTPGAGRDSSQKQLRKLMIRWSEIPKLSVWETSIKCVSHSVKLAEHKHQRLFLFKQTRATTFNVKQILFSKQVNKCSFSTFSTFLQSVVYMNSASSSVS